MDTTDSKIAVTGSSGFIGSVICRLFKIPAHMQFDIVNGREGDITRSDTMENLCRDTETIIHLAAMTGLKECDEDPSGALKLNVETTEELATKAKFNGVKRFIFASSSAVYGEARSYVMDENHPCEPRSIYGKTKKQAEERLFDLEDDSFQVIALRKSNVYGYGMHWKGRTVLDQFIMGYLLGKPLQIAGTGGQKRDFVDVIDVARLYGRIATSQNTRSGVFNVGGPETLSIRALAELVNDIGESIFSYRVPLEFKPGGEGVTWHDFRYDWSKARMEFNYMPKFQIDDYTKARMLQHMRQNHE